jgi:hypothetical protein
MSDMNKIVKIKELVESAESALKLANMLLAEATGMATGSSVDLSTYTEKASSLTRSSTSTGGRIIEGVFDGQNMIDKKGTMYPVPANYASKSKLIPGDVLKLTVTEEGKFLYKQIGPVERKNVIGPLVYNDGRYQILAGGKAYNVLLASVTYFRAQVGDEITLIIPKNEDSDWGAIEAVLPKFEEDHTATESPAPAKKGKKKMNLEEELDI